MISDDETWCVLPTGLGVRRHDFNHTPAVEVDVTSPGDLACLRVQRAAGLHPGAAGTIDGQHYWTLTGTRSDGAAASGFTLTLRLPRGGLADPLLCRHLASSIPPLPGDWDCDRDGMDAEWVWRQVTALSDWALSEGPVPVRLQRFSIE